MKINFPQVISQFDSRYSSILLGYNKDPKFNIYNYGCLLCTLVMVCRYYGKDETPETLNQKLKDVEGFSNGGNYVHGAISRIYPNIQERVVRTPEPLTDQQIQDIKDSLDRGEPVMVGIDYNPRTLAYDSHFSPLIDYNPNDENDFTMADTLGGQIRSLKDYLSNFRPNARKSIETYFVYSGTPVQNIEVKPENTTLSENSTNTPTLPANYDTIVKQSTQYESVARFVFPDQQPEHVLAENIINNLNSRLTASKSDTGEFEKKWTELIEYLELDKSPSDASFENVKRVIAGIKSRFSDLETQIKDGKKEITKLETEKEVLNTKIGTLNKQMTQEAKLQKTKIKSLKDNAPNFTTLVTQYEGVIGELRGQVEVLTNELGEVKIEANIAEVEKVSSSKPINGNSRGILNSIIKLFKHIIILR